MSLLDFHPDEMTDEQISARLAQEYPPEDFAVHWWWDWPEKRLGFCISTAFKHALRQSDFKQNIYELQGRG